jgi:Xaa-Pro aminopeptidase
MGIGTATQYSEVALVPGNVLSNEPGYYEDGSFGIRIENMMFVTEAKTTHTFGDKSFLTFEHVTLVPICQKLIDTSLLTKKEIDFLNKYHEEVLQKTQSFFKNDPLTLEWLKRETQPLVKA